MRREGRLKGDGWSEVKEEENVKGTGRDRGKSYKRNG